MIVFVETLEHCNVDCPDLNIECVKLYTDFGHICHREFRCENLEKCRRIRDEIMRQEKMNNDRQTATDD